MPRVCGNGTLYIEQSQQLVIPATLEPCCRQGKVRQPSPHTMDCLIYGSKLVYIQKN